MYYRKKTFYESKKHFIMAVPVMRYQRYKDLSDKSSPQKYYLKQEPGIWAGSRNIFWLTKGCTPHALTC